MRVLFFRERKEPKESKVILFYFGSPSVFLNLTVFLFAMKKKNGSVYFRVVLSFLLGFGMMSMILTQPSVSLVLFRQDTGTGLALGLDLSCLLERELRESRSHDLIDQDGKQSNVGNDHTLGT